MQIIKNCGIDACYQSMFMDYLEKCREEDYYYEYDSPSPQTNVYNTYNITINTCNINHSGLEQTSIATCSISTDLIKPIIYLSPTGIIN